MFLWKSFPNFSEPVWFKMSNVGENHRLAILCFWHVESNKGEKVIYPNTSYRFHWKENNWGGETWAIVHVQDGLRDLCFISTVTQKLKAENVVLCALSCPKNVS